MSSEEANNNEQKEQMQNEENDINNNADQNNLLLDLYDEDTLNISLEEEKPLFTKLYSNIMEKISTVMPESEQSNEFLTNFENLFKNQIEIINSCVKNNESNFIYATNVLVAKIKIFNFFGTKYLDDFLSKSDLDSTNILKLISENLTKSVNKMVEIIQKLSQKSNEINNLFDSLQNKLSQNDLFIRQLNDKNKILNEKYIKLKEENELITQKLINNSYFNNFGINNNNFIIENSNLENSNPNISSNIIPKLKVKYVHLDMDNPRNLKENQIYNIQYPSQNYLKEKSINPFTHNNINSNLILTNLSLAGNRVFTLKMMKEVISNIYTSKATFDKKCVINKQPKQTMEEYMYTYLNYK